jgi:hypothetical protein
MRSAVGRKKSTPTWQRRRPKVRKGDGRRGAKRGKRGKRDQGQGPPVDGPPTFFRRGRTAPGRVNRGRHPCFLVGYLPNPGADHPSVDPDCGEREPAVCHRRVPPCRGQGILGLAFPCAWSWNEGWKERADRRNLMGCAAVPSGPGVWVSSQAHRRWRGRLRRHLPPAMYAVLARRLLPWWRRSSHLPAADKDGQVEALLAALPAGLEQYQTQLGAPGVTVVAVPAATE